MPNKTALVIDDMPDHLFIVKSILQALGFEVFIINPKMDPVNWREFIPKNPTSIVVTDYDMGNIIGPEVIGVLKQRWTKNCPNIICWKVFGLSSWESNLAISAGAAATCEKILSRATVEEIVNRYAG